MSPASSRYGQPVEAGSEKVHLIQGEFRVAKDPNVILTTTLGSCVATCLRDPVAGVGGMNHFLLPHGDEYSGSDAVRYGAYAMEVLINDLMHAGALHERLEARLFGGARLSDGLPDIGGQNVDFAERFLRDEGIPLLGGSVRGSHARRIQFWPVSGRARQLALTENAIFEAEYRKPRAPVTGSVELF